MNRNLDVHVLIVLTVSVFILYSVQLIPKSYLFHAVKKRAIDYLHKDKKTVPVTASLDSLQASPFRDLMEEADVNNRINEGISRLPGRCREIFVINIKIIH